MKGTAACALICAAALLAAGGCKAGRPRPDVRFVGVWSGGSYPVPGEPYPTTLRIDPSGAYTWLGKPGKWSVEEDALVLKPEGDGRPARLRIEGSTGLLTDGFTDGLTFRRVAAAPPP